MAKQLPKKPAPTPPKRQPVQQKAKPRTKEDAIRQAVEQDPQKAAEMIRQILKNFDK